MNHNLIYNDKICAPIFLSNEFGKIWGDLQDWADDHNVHIDLCIYDFGIERSDKDV